MRMIYHGPLWPGSTALQRVEGFRHWLGDDVIAVDDQHRIARHAGWRRWRDAALWRIGYPLDQHGSIARLSAAILEHRPDVVFIDSSQYVSRAVVRRFRAIHPAVYVFYTPDDIVARHNRSRWVASSLREWDLLFTTKTFNLPELAGLGVRKPVLIGKAFDPALHRPMLPEAVGPDYERFDAVFMGAYEGIRWAAVKALAEAGMSVVVYTNQNWPRAGMPANVELRPTAFDRDYVRALHFGKFALGFLRKINRDQITQRSMEITAAGRAMLAEKTAEHDAHFIDGEEYLGYQDLPELVSQARALLADPMRRARIAEAGRQRCLNSGYSIQDRARLMLDAIEIGLSSITSAAAQTNNQSGRIHET